MASRLVILDGDRKPLMERVRRLADERSVLIVSAVRPLPLLKADLQSVGTDMEHVFIVDCVTDELRAVVEDPEHEAYVPNASLLELIASRVRRIIIDKAERPATIVVDDVQSFAHVAPTAALIEMAGIIRAWAGRKNHVEYIMHPGTIDATAEGHVRAAVDEVRALLPSGELADA